MGGDSCSKGREFPTPYTGWTFFTFICCKNCNAVCLKKPKINEKEAGLAHFLLNRQRVGSDLINQMKS